MEIKEMVEVLRSRGDTLSAQAADSLTELERKCDELGKAYDALSSDLFMLYKNIEKEKAKEKGKNQTGYDVAFSDYT